MKTGQRLKEARIACGMTQEEAAHWCEFERSQIANIESCRHEPRLETLRRLADCYGKTVSELIGEVPPSPRQMSVIERKAVDLLLAAMRGEMREQIKQSAASAASATDHSR